MTNGDKPTWKKNKINYQNEYNKNKYDRIILNFPIGSKEEINKYIKGEYKSITDYFYKLYLQDKNK